MNYQLNNEESFSFDCGCNVVLSPEIWICRVWRNLQATSIFPNPTEGMNLTLIIWKLRSLCVRQAMPSRLQK
ncbi:hypothetical protein DTO027B5_757 [Paecilomyces variotii]|nr:hypothetical protein DTO169C6_458 [Paecilomyces variotii]KAJ9290040.1 hypothetical protein DTO021C3_2398 [Paecilomyces variotii]KAJ9329572.1 hypothetical protein DTO027B3_59 [Paecilomyces variotii]KAJ9337408.1 hypothetical protein DTO027B5_757 [Paecilomyces variotii]